VTYEQLIEHYGTQRAAADALGLQPPSVCVWQTTGIPPPRQAQYELLTKGKLKADRPIAKSA
jgi:DNA-binding transcriptional regulator YdaS (Cro superfamily)